MRAPRMPAPPPAPALALVALLALPLVLVPWAAPAAAAVRRRNPWLSACDLDFQPSAGGVGSNGGGGGGGGGGPDSPSEAGRLARAVCAGGEAALRRAALPHCRERRYYSALDARSRRHAAADEDRCARLLADLLHLDALAASAARDLRQVLRRYDCDQTFSVIHDCSHCQEAYRRWVCSSLVPLFVTEGDLMAGAEDEGPGRGSSPQRRGRATGPGDAYGPHHPRPSPAKLNNNNNNYYNNNINRYDDDDEDDDDLLLFVDDVEEAYADVANVANSVNVTNLYEMGPGREAWRDPRTEHRMVEARRELDNRLARPNRTRREPKQQEEPLYRVKPCLSVCQGVEQACPYFLPGDRAPSYPTQYAGEPTFLCLDPNIQETGEQLRKSNYGIPECCYNYCGINGEEICHQCTVLPPQDQPFAPPCGSNSPSTITSSASVLASSPVIIFLTFTLKILNSAYNKIVLLERHDAYIINPVNIITFDTVYYYIKQIMKIIPCTRL